MFVLYLESRLIEFGDALRELGQSRNMFFKYNNKIMTFTDLRILLHVNSNGIFYISFLVSLYYYIETLTMYLNGENEGN